MGERQFLFGINSPNWLSAQDRAGKGANDLNLEENICVHCSGTSSGVVTVYLNDDLRLGTI